MLSARAIHREIRDHDETYRLFCSIAMKGEAQGGWENRRIAERMPDPALRPKVARHGADEDKHGRLFGALLRKRGLEPCEVPFDADYTLRLERRGIGLSHARLRRDEVLSVEEVLAYLAHSRVTEQRAHEEVEQLLAVFGDDPDLRRAVRMIADDERNHLSFAHEELQRYCERGYRPLVERMLREYARAEVETYRDVSLSVMRRMARDLRWPAWKRALLGFGIRAIYVVERLWTWRRMARIEPPERPGALAPASPHPHGPGLAG